jgi:hypothetical protein
MLVTGMGWRGGGGHSRQRILWKALSNMPIGLYTKSRIPRLQQRDVVVAKVKFH